MAHKKTFKNIVKDYLPVSVAREYLKRRSFAEGFRNWEKTGNDVILPQTSKYNKVVSVQGFNYSGSGAVIDFLREYPRFTVLGYVDTPEDSGGYTPKSLQLSEIDFIRLAGGLFEIEHYIDCDNLFFRDALLNRTTKCFGSSSLYKYSDEVRELMYRFFSQMTELRTENLKFAYNNAYLIGLNEIPDIYYMRNMTRKEYHKLCCNFLTAVFNTFYQEGKDFLAADQLLADNVYDNARNLEYIPNLKTILVPRDPRDTYTWAIIRNQPHMEHSTVERFIKWYKHMYVNVKPWEEKEGCLITRYENLVLDYEKQEKRINEYLGLTPEDHELRQQYFRPEFSKRFVGIYKDLQGHEKDFEMIKSELGDYCNSLID